MKSYFDTPGYSAIEKLSRAYHIDPTQISEINVEFDSKEMMILFKTFKGEKFKIINGKLEIAK